MKTAVVSFLVALSISSAAAAERFVVSVSGLTDAGAVDGQALFGPPQGGLGQLPYVLTTTFDTTHAGATFFSGLADVGGDLLPNEYLLGSGASAPVIRSRLEIGGLVFNLTPTVPSGAAHVQKTDAPEGHPFFGDQFAMDIRGSAGSDLSIDFSMILDGDPSLPTLCDGVGLGAPADFTAPYVTFSLALYGAPPVYYASGITEFFSRAPHVTVSTAPEPTAWALLIVGFGLTGAMLRRRSSPLISVM